MDYYAGIDVSLESASVCVVETSGKIVREGKVTSEPAALIAWFGSLGFTLTRIGLEAGPLSQWLYAALRDAGLAVELLETRHVSSALKAMPIKTDRNDARGIAQLIRLGWFRPVHCKSIAAQEMRALLTARKLIQAKLFDVEMSVRGILSGSVSRSGRRRRAALLDASVSWSPATPRWRWLRRRCCQFMRFYCESSTPSRNNCGRWPKWTHASGY
jgi:transposase